jgi:glyceraldehyde 3-phosphate dehydrogenase
MKNIAINGFGRIGRHVFRHLLDNYSKNVKVVAINDLTDPETLAHLLKYDSVYGIYKKEISVDGNNIVVDNQRILILNEKDPLNLPWKKMKVDIVLECTGLFSDFNGAKKHINAGAKKVIISAPSKDPDKIPSFCLNINVKGELIKSHEIIDMGSCTTNCAAILAEVLHRNFKIKKALFSTIHSYTNDQRILDLPHKDLRRARAAGLNIIPTTTGAAKTIQKVIPDLKGKVDAISFRVPTPTVSVVDFICEVEKDVTKEEVINAFKKAEKSKDFKGILGVEDKPLVSSDFKGTKFSAVFDSSLTMIVGNMVRVVGWYDNESGYAYRLAQFTNLVSSLI